MEEQRWKRAAARLFDEARDDNVELSTVTLNGNVPNRIGTCVEEIDVDTGVMGRKKIEAV